jgi:hypothetical protein
MLKRLPPIADENTRADAMQYHVHPRKVGPAQHWKIRAGKGS